VPYTGTLELDFVEITKPDPFGDSKDADYHQMDAAEFDDFVGDICRSAAGDHAQQLGRIRQFSNSKFFTCEQIAALLSFFEESAHRVEICVIAFARTIDWHCYNNIIYRLSPLEKRQLLHRIGLVNLFDETMAVDYYELDLAHPAQRLICQEIVHLASVEPGNNVVDCTLDGVDFDIPAMWLSDVPRRGLLCLYYCREQKVIEKVCSLAKHKSCFIF
jgi:hypothetical protein